MRFHKPASFPSWCCWCWRRSVRIRKKNLPRCWWLFVVRSRSRSRSKTHSLSIKLTLSSHAKSAESTSRLNHVTSLPGDTCFFFLQVRSKTDQLSMSRVPACLLLPSVLMFIYRLRLFTDYPTTNNDNDNNRGASRSCVTSQAPGNFLFLSFSLSINNYLQVAYVYNGAQVCLCFCFLFFLLLIYMIYLAFIRPTRTNTGQQRPTKANDGQRWPTQAHSSQHRSTKAVWWHG